MPIVDKAAKALHILFSEDPSAKTGRNISYLAEKKLGLTANQARSLVHLWKNIRNPASALRHNLLARPYLKDGTGTRIADMREGVAPFAIADIENGSEVLALLQRLWTERCENQIDPRFPWAKAMKPFLRDCFLPSDFREFPQLADFFLNDYFLQTAINYFGAVPRLSTAQLWWSPANQEMVGSQLWHFDNEDRHQFKIFVNVFDVTEQMGPFTYLPASLSGGFKDPTGKTVGRLDDDFVLGRLGGKTPRQAIGRAGQGLIVDTSRCLHMGSRTQTGNRVVLMVQYVPHNVQHESTGMPPLLDPSRYVGDPARSLIAAQTVAAHRFAPATGRAN